MRNAGSPGNSGVRAGSFTWLRNTARPNAGDGPGARSAPVAGCRSAAAVAAPATNNTRPVTAASVLRTDVDIAPSFARRYRGTVSREEGRARAVGRDALGVCARRGTRRR